MDAVDMGGLVLIISLLVVVRAAAMEEKAPELARAARQRSMDNVLAQTVH